MSIRCKLLLASVVVVSVALSGCTSKVADSTHYSGFLPDYSKLRPEQSASGNQTLRWVSPDYKSSDYRGIVYPPVIYYPRASPNARVSQQTLDQIRTYTDQQMKAAVAKRKPLVTQPGPGVLVMKTAITAVSAENQGVQFYEVVPVAAVIAGTMAASGHRTQESALFLEVQLIDSQTGKPVIEVVRKGIGKNVANSNAPINFDDLKTPINLMVEDTVNFSATP
ncbi:hypothetical protein J2125_003751 [Erwinia toletana]|uniref:DUF3313 domain-containing protein n=1 Tax=Winslowiella toletana TaxID=92490 RepID=A0ABS4PD39_9GAMM|nr:DUF3313 domain-containing protein [Winslowiella toletana]MBP2170559.1 hypothetical protein [Winslowiella toletana]